MLSFFLLTFLNSASARNLKYNATNKSDPVPSAGLDDAVELTLTRWWKELLGVESVNSRASFFDLGGNSLTGVRLLAQVKRKYGVELQSPALFTAPTIEKLCALVREQTNRRHFLS